MGEKFVAGAGGDEAREIGRALKRDGSLGARTEMSAAWAQGREILCAVASVARKPSSLIDTRVIFCGDNLEQLKKLPDGCVDLIYIDPPFNSNRNYEVFWGETKEKRSFEDRHESTQAYIEFMRPRCVELARVLKKTGSFYYHCDWHASHYVKVMLDRILGENNFQNEIVWKRTSAHNDPNRYGAVHDNIFFYTGSKKGYTWNHQFTPYTREYIDSEWQELPSGRFFKGENMLDPQNKMAEFDFMGTKARWRTNFDGMMELWSAPQTEVPNSHGRILLRKDGMPRKRCRIVFLDELPGVPLQSWWGDIAPIAGGALERLGYPTQKPLSLLERIIKSSSNENDIVLDAFCGCGTALIAAQNLGRQWIGIDVSPTACRVMAKRLRDVCRLPEDEKLWKVGRGFIVRDLPWTEKQLRVIPPFEFENWAVIALGGIPNKAQVGDMGIDGRIYPVSSMPRQSGKKAGELDFMDAWYPIQVKQKDKAGRPDIDSFEAVMMREDRAKGFFVSFEFSSDALREIDAFFRREHRVIIPFTVREILEETIANKLA
jgi:DNA modification methylase